MLSAKEFSAFLNPFLVNGIGCSFDFLVRTHTINAAFENITEQYGIDAAKYERKLKLEARLRFEPG
jgi:hypothetical protein